MTPLKIEMLLHYYASPTPFNLHGKYNPDAVRCHVAELMHNELIMPTEPGPTDIYGLTDRGQVYVEALLDMPLPVCVWEVPK